MQISEKDLLYLKDQLSHELLAAKKCNDYANQTNDQQLKTLYQDLTRKHESHYNTLLNQMSGANIQ